MSEQIDSVLREMQNKFEQSFSQKDLNLSDYEQVSQNNPQSGQKAVLQKGLSMCQGTFFDNDQQIQKQLVQQLDQKEDYQRPENAAMNSAFQQKGQPQQNDKHPIELFQESSTQGLEKELNKAISEQQFYRNQLVGVEGGEEGKYQYKQLTLKLERALHKISSETVIRHQNHKNTLYDRFQQYQSKKNKEIQRKKKEMQQQQNKSLRDRPLINSHSRNIISQMKEDPLFLRYEKIIDKKKAKQSEYERIRQERTQKEYQQFEKQHKRHMQALKKKYKNDHLRSTQEYYDQMQNWLRTRQKNLQSQKNQRLERQKKEFTFKPLINSKSQKILSKKTMNNRVPIQERQPTIRQIQPDPECTFKPKINKSYFHKKQNFDYYDNCKKL